MGQIHYDGDYTPISVDDIELAHVKTVIVSKMRRGESFALSWSDGASRNTIWLHPAIKMRFDFDGVERPELDPERLRELSEEGLDGRITLRVA